MFDSMFIFLTLQRKATFLALRPNKTRFIKIRGLFNFLGRNTQYVTGMVFQNKNKIQEFLREQDVAKSPKLATCRVRVLFVFSRREFWFLRPRFPLARFPFDLPQHRHQLSSRLESMKREKPNTRGAVNLIIPDQRVASGLCGVLCRGSWGLSPGRLGGPVSAGHLRVRRSCLQPHVSAKFPSFKYLARGS